VKGEGEEYVTWGRPVEIHTYKNGEEFKRSRKIPHQTVLWLEKLEMPSSPQLFRPFRARPAGFLRVYKINKGPTKGDNSVKTYISPCKSNKT